MHSHNTELLYCVYYCILQCVIALGVLPCFLQLGDVWGRVAGPANLEGGTSFETRRPNVSSGWWREGGWVGEEVGGISMNGRAGLSCKVRRGR